MHSLGAISYSMVISKMRKKLFTHTKNINGQVHCLTRNESNASKKVHKEIYPHSIVWDILLKRKKGFNVSIICIDNCFPTSLHVSLSPKRLHFLLVLQQAAGVVLQTLYSNKPLDHLYVANYQQE